LRYYSEISTYENANTPIYKIVRLPLGFESTLGSLIMRHGNAALNN